MTPHFSIREPTHHASIYDRFTDREDMVIEFDPAQLHLSFRDGEDIYLEVADELAADAGATESFSLPLADLVYRYLIRSPAFRTTMHSAYPLLDYFAAKPSDNLETYKHDGISYQLYTENVESEHLMLSAPDNYQMNDYPDSTLEIEMDPDIAPTTPCEPI